MAIESVALTLDQRDQLNELMANSIAVVDLLSSAAEGGAEVTSKTLAQVTYMLRNQLQDAATLAKGFYPVSTDGLIKA